MRRAEAWLKFARQEHLRHLPDAGVLKLLVESRGATRTVDAEKSVSFNNATYRLRHLSQINIGDKLEVRPAPYAPGDVFVTVESLDGKKQVFQVSPIERDALGFATDAALIGSEHKSAPETPRDALKKDAMKQAYGAGKLEEAEKAKAKNSPIYPQLDPFAHVKQDDVPAYMPRRGNEIIRAPELPRMTPMNSIIALSNLLNRPLTAAEGDELRGAYPHGCTDADIQAMAQKWDSQRDGKPKLALVK
jgi:hypothetical protein